MAGAVLVLGLGLGVLLFSIAPPCLTPRAVATQVLRGDKLNLSVTTETNLVGLTNQAFVPTNFLSGKGNVVGIPLASAVTNAARSEVTIDGGRYRTATFQQLAGFEFEVTEEMIRPDASPSTATAQALDHIPPDVKALNGKAVALTGYMLPVKWRERLVTDFMLLPNTMGCCYGRMPRINEIIIVNTSGKGVTLMRDIPVCVLGTFHVGAIRNNNYLIGIYQMDCEHVVETRSLTSI